MINLNLTLEEFVWIMDSLDPKAPKPPLCNDVALIATAKINAAFGAYLNRSHPLPLPGIPGMRQFTFGLN